MYDSAARRSLVFCLVLHASAAQRLLRAISTSLSMIAVISLKTMAKKWRGDI